MGVFPGEWHPVSYLVCFLSITVAGIAVQQDASCTVEPFTEPDQNEEVSVYHGIVTLDRLWMKAYLDENDPAYKQLHDDIYTAIYNILSCQLTETKDTFRGLTNITFSEGSVRVDWDGVFDQPLANPEQLSGSVAQELSTTEAFKDTIIASTDVQIQLNTVFASIAGVTGIITLIAMIYGIVKNMKEKVSKPGFINNTGNASKPTQTGADTIVQPQTAGDKQSPADSTDIASGSEAAESAPQGYAIVQAYPVSAAPNYAFENSVTMETAPQGYVMPQTYVMSGSPEFDGSADYNVQTGVEAQGYIMPRTYVMSDSPEFNGSADYNVKTGVEAQGYIMPRTYVMSGSQEFDGSAGYNVQTGVEAQGYIMPR